MNNYDIEWRKHLVFTLPEEMKDLHQGVGSLVNWTVSLIEQIEQYLEWFWRIL